MNDPKDIGLDVHQTTISIAVLDSSGKLLMESILETKRHRSAVCPGIARSLHGAFEEGTCAHSRRNGTPEV